MQQLGLLSGKGTMIYPRPDDTVSTNIHQHQPTPSAPSSSSSHARPIVIVGDTHMYSGDWSGGKHHGHGYIQFKAISNSVVQSGSLNLGNCIVSMKVNYFHR